MGQHSRVPHGYRSPHADHGRAPGRPPSRGADPPAPTVTIIRPHTHGQHGLASTLPMMDRQWPSPREGRPASSGDRHLGPHTRVRHVPRSPAAGHGRQRSQLPPGNGAQPAVIVIWGHAVAYRRVAGPQIPIMAGTGRDRRQGRGRLRPAGIDRLLEPRNSIQHGPRTRPADREGLRGVRLPGRPPEGRQRDRRSRRHSLRRPVANPHMSICRSRSVAGADPPTEEGPTARREGDHRLGPHSPPRARFPVPTCRSWKRESHLPEATDSPIAMIAISGRTASPARLPVPTCRSRTGTRSAAQQRTVPPPCTRQRSTFGSTHLHPARLPVPICRSWSDSRPAASKAGAGPPAPP